jgi:hypothetical protein
MLADWITLDIPWWVIVLGFIGLAFWPLTALTAAMALLAWRTRLKAVRILFWVPLAFWLVSGYVNLAPHIDNAVKAYQTRHRTYVPGSGTPGDFTLARDTTIDGVLCAENTVVSIDFLGRLTECTLPRPEIVRGVPCRQGPISVDYRVFCTLSADYPRFGYVWRPDTRIQDYGGDNVYFRVGPHPPTLTQHGSPLAQNTEVQFDSGKLLAITPP